MTNEQRNQEIIFLVKLLPCVSGQHKSNSVRRLCIYYAVLICCHLCLLQLLHSTENSAASLSIVNTRLHGRFYCFSLRESATKRFICCCVKTHHQTSPFYAVIVRQYAAETAGNFIDGLLLLMCVYDDRDNSIDSFPISALHLPLSASAYYFSSPSLFS